MHFRTIAFPRLIREFSYRIVLNASMKDVVMKLKEILMRRQGFATICIYVVYTSDCKARRRDIGRDLERSVQKTKDFYF